MIVESYAMKKFTNSKVDFENEDKSDVSSSTTSTLNFASSADLNSKSFGTKNSLLSSSITLLGTISGTAALVGMHHYYRKQQQPDARLADYLTGLKTQLQSLSAFAPATTTPLSRLQFSYQQAKQAWQQSAEYGSTDHQSLQQSTQTNTLVNFSDLHTTLLVPRSVCWISGVSSMPKPTYPISSTNRNDIANDERCFGVVGIDAERQIVWQTTMPERVHDIVIQPKFDNPLAIDKARHVVVMGRRPSEKFWMLDTATGQVQYAIKADADRHFYGHACYSLDGTQLYVTENDTVSLEGKIGIYDATNGYQKMVEFDSHGIGPHELIMHSDGETLIVANGGIKTEQASREELNLDSMRPSLVYLNRHTGELLEQIIPEHNQMSIRHLAIHDNGTVMIGIQFQGEKHINVPLVLTHQRGDAEFTSLTMPNNQWQRFHQYIASVAVDSEYNLLCVTTPIGGCAAVYDLKNYQLIDSVTLLDCAGVSITLSKDEYKDSFESFVVSDGQGQLTTLRVDKLNKHITTDSQSHNMAFDNHLQSLA